MNLVKVLSISLVVGITWFAMNTSENHREISSVRRVLDYTEINPKRVLNHKNRFKHLEYMGFYASAMGQWNFTDDLKGFTNLTWVAYGSRNANIEKLIEAKNLGIKAVIDLQFIFDFKTKELKPNAKELLAEFYEMLEENELLDTIAMVYPQDEPYLHAKSKGNKSIDQYFPIMNRANQLIRKFFPKKPIGVIFSHSKVKQRDFRIPESFDWVGFDCYRSIWDCDGKSFVGMYNLMIHNMKPHQRLMAVPEAYMKVDVFEEDTGFDDWLKDELREKNITTEGLLRKRLKHHYEIALSEPRFIAFIPFMWSWENAKNRGGYGASEMSGGLVQDLKKIGRQIKTGKHVYPAMKYGETEKLRSRPDQKYRGAISHISPQGVASGWAFEYAMKHKPVQVRLKIDESTQRVMRTNVIDWSLAGKEIKRSYIGVHGLRYEIPEQFKDGCTHTLKMEILNVSGKVKRRSSKTFKIGSSNKPCANRRIINRRFRNGRFRFRR